MPRLLAMLFLLLGLFCAAALPAHAEDDYNTTLDRLSRLQALAREFSSSRDDAPDPIVLTLSYTRTGDYNTTIWQLTAGVRDTEFESYVNSSDAELASLQSLNTVTLPTGEKIDFGHMLASMNLVYNGIPITGSWGGDCQQLAQQISMHYPRLDGVLHNAGLLGDICPMDEQKPEVWQQVMQVNVNGTFMLTQALLPLLLRSDAGSLVFTSSSVGRQGRANWGAYAVSKFATEGMMQVLADEYQSRHLRVNCINPGGTRTGMRASAFPTEDPLKLKTPADIMPVYLWLMGDDSRRKTGMTFDAQPGRKPGIAQ